MEALYNELKSRLILDVRKELWPEIKTFITQQIEIGFNELKKKVAIEEEYMPMKYFLNKYEFSRETFRRILNSGHVHSYYKTGKKLYHVEQFKMAHDKYQPQKPVFMKAMKSAA